MTLFPKSSFLPVSSLHWLPSLTMGSHCLLSSCKQVGLSTAQWPRVTTQLPNSCRLLSLHKISYLSCVCSPFSKISFLGRLCSCLLPSLLSASSSSSHCPLDSVLQRFKYLLSVNNIKIVQCCSILFKKQQSWP